MATNSEASVPQLDSYTTGLLAGQSATAVGVSRPKMDLISKAKGF